jgi:HTH-type transcriptional regulator/antitoxin HigA
MLETKYRLELARRKHTVPPTVAQRAKLFQRLPITEMVKRGWIRGGNDVNDLHRQACEFLGVNSIDDDPAMFASLRRSTVADDVVGAQRAWVRRVEIAAEQQHVQGQFSAQSLRNALPSIRALAADEESVAEVPRVLARLGIRFVVVAPIPRAKVDGAAIFGLSGPIVGLSLRYDRIDWFWFTLMHELAHLALDHKGGHLDALEPSAAKDKDENEADTLAEESLISPRAFNDFTRKNPRMSKAAVEEFARVEKLHPGIVVGRLHFTQVLPYSHFRSYLVRVAHHLKAWVDSE